MNVILRKLFITIVLCVLYRLGFFFSLIPSGTQGLGLDQMEQLLGDGGHSLFLLGFIPAISGYFLTEIIFLIIPKFRAIRNNGFKGRQLINKWSLGISFAIATFQSWTIVRFLESARTMQEEPLIQNPSLIVLISYSLFFVVGFSLTLLLGKLISKYGIGNGFCVLIALSMIEAIYKNISHYFQNIKANHIMPNYIGFLILASLLLLIFCLLRKKDWVIPIQDEKISSLAIPFFLQGATVLTLSESFFYLPELFQSVGVTIPKIPEYGTWGHALTLSSLTIVTSTFGYWIFSGVKRISSNLAVGGGSINLNFRPFLFSTVTLFFLVLAFNMPFPFWNQMIIPYTVSLFSAMTFIAIGLDIWQQWQFETKYQNVVEIADLDNVYLTSVLKEKLDESKIEHAVQSYQYRKLYFFFQPFIKMKLLVPIEKREEAQNIIKLYATKNI